MIALLRFQLASGGRIALRAAIPLAGAVIVAIGLQQDPAGFVEHMATAIAGIPPSTPALAILFMICLGLSQWAVLRVTLGSDGWIRHLPVSGTQHRIALILAVVYAQAPLLVATAGCAALYSFRTGRLSWPGFLVPPLIAIATSFLAIGTRWRRHAGVQLHSWPHAVPFAARVALRALGARLPSAWLAGAVPLAAAFLFVKNNALPAELVGLAARLGGALAVAFTLAQLADNLAVRRPSWPWARSLPVGSARRITGDVALLAAACAPILAAVVALDPLAALVVGAVIPLFAVRAAAAMRRDGTTRSAAAGPVLMEGAFASGLVALLPWLAMTSIVVLPLVFRDAVRRDRELKVTRWSALHHIAAGDTFSWTD